MSNIVTILRGESNEAIVVLAHRDNVPPGADAANSALGTAVVVELAAAFADQRERAHARPRVRRRRRCRRRGRAAAGGPPAERAEPGRGDRGPGHRPCRADSVADRSDGRDRAAAGFAEGVVRRAGGRRRGHHRPAEVPARAGRPVRAARAFPAARRRSSAVASRRSRSARILARRATRRPTPTASPTPRRPSTTSSSRSTRAPHRAARTAATSGPGAACCPAG